MAIEVFRGENFYLSNMFPLRVRIPTSHGLYVPTSEHLYMAERFVERECHSMVASARGACDDTRPYKDGLAAKRLAYELMSEGAELVDESEVARIGLMRVAVEKKFRADFKLARQLIATGTEDIVEGNDWGDTFWGVDPIASNNGANNLGIILMDVRRQLIEETRT